MASINTIVKRKQYLWLGIVVVGTASAIGGALYLSDVDMSGNGETVAEQEPVPDMTGVVDTTFDDKVRQHATTEMQVTAAQMQKQYEEIRRELDVLNKQRGDDQRRIEKLGQDNAALAEQVKALGANPVTATGEPVPQMPASPPGPEGEPQPGNTPVSFPPQGSVAVPPPTAFYPGNGVTPPPQVTYQSVPVPNLDEVHEGLLLQAVRASWLAKENRARIDDVVDFLKNASDSEQYAESPTIRSRLDEMIVLLDQYTANGTYGQYFNSDEPSLRDDAKMVVLELGGLEDRPSLLVAVMFSLIIYIENRMYRTPRNLKKLNVIDEGWRLLDFKNHKVGEFIEKGYRTARRHTGAYITITQNIVDFDSDKASSAARAAWGNSSYKIILKQSAKEFAKYNQLYSADASFTPVQKTLTAGVAFTSSHPVRVGNTKFKRHTAMKLRLVVRVKKASYTPYVVWSESCPFSKELGKLTKTECTEAGGNRTLVKDGQSYSMYQSCWAYRDTYVTQSADKGTCQTYTDNRNPPTVRMLRTTKTDTQLTVAPLLLDYLRQLRIKLTVAAFFLQTDTQHFLRTELPDADGQFV